MRGQVLAIALVIVSGVGTFIMSRSTLDSLNTDARGLLPRLPLRLGLRRALKRAPESLVERMREIPGVEAVDGACRSGGEARYRGIRRAGDRQARLLAVPRPRRPEPPPCTRGAYDRSGPRRRGDGDRHLREGPRASPGDEVKRHHKRQAQDARHRRHRALARVYISDKPRGDIPRLRPLRRLLDVAHGSGGRLRHGGGLQ